MKSVLLGIVRQNGFENLAMASLQVWSKLAGARDLAAQRAQPVRLAGAQRIGEFDGEPFRNFVEDWLRVESEAAVIAALGGARTKQKAGTEWSAMQAVGPPDANPLQDDPKAAVTRCVPRRARRMPRTCRARNARTCRSGRSASIRCAPSADLVKWTQGRGRPAAPFDRSCSSISASSRRARR